MTSLEISAINRRMRSVASGKTIRIFLRVILQIVVIKVYMPEIIAGWLKKKKNSSHPKF